MPAYSGIWTLSQQFQGRGQGLWPALPTAPTIGTATAGRALCASVTFTAPSCVGVPSPLTYTVTSTPGSVTATGSASPVVITGLTCSTAYTFKVKAITASGGIGPCSAASNSATAFLATCETFTAAGTYSWVVPAGVTSAAMLAVGGGQAGGNPCYGYNAGRGGSLAYLNGRAVTPGTTYTVVVAAGVNGTTTTNPGTGNNSSVAIGGTDVLRAVGGNSGAGNVGTASYLGGSGGIYGGGGAAGYSGAGGIGGGAYASGSAGAGGGAGGGSSYGFCNGCSYGYNGGASGGGVGIFGQGSNGAGGVYSGSGGNTAGKGGSGGTAGGDAGPSTAGRSGGNYGGGGGGGGRIFFVCTCSTSYGAGGAGQSGAVRIVWAGPLRGTPSFPSTNVGA